MAACDCRLIAKIVITTIQVNLVPNLGESNKNTPELSISAVPLGTCEKAKACKYRES